jgi:hypothetical protein
MFNSAEGSRPERAPVLTVVRGAPVADTTPPTVALTAPASGATVSGSVALAADAADNLGVAAVAFAVDGTTIATDTAAPYAAVWDADAAPAGPHTISARALDAAGNAAASAVTVTVADHVAPTVAFTAPAPGASVGETVTVAAVAADAGSGVSRVEFRANGELIGTAETAPYAVTWVAHGDTLYGAYTLEARAIDGAGNAATTTIEVVSNAPRPPDTAAPAVTLTTPADGATVAGSVTLAASATDDRGVAAVVFAVDGVTLATDTAAPYAASWDASAAAYGAHTVTATAYDAAGNSAADGATVTVADDTAPDVAITAPAQGAVVTGTVELSASATDRGGVSAVAFAVDGTLIATDAAAPYEASWDASGAAPGSHAITARAIDAAGNAATATVSVTVPVPADLTVKIGRAFGDVCPDTYLYSYVPATNYAKGTYTMVGGTGTTVTKTVLRFPLARLAGSGASAATLQLTRYSGPAAVPLRAYRLRRVVPEQATWAQWATGSAWATPGAADPAADYFAAPAATGSSDGTFDVTALAQAALAEGAPTLDLIVVDPAPAASRYVMFNSAEGSRPERAPVLTVLKTR